MDLKPEAPTVSYPSAVDKGRRAEFKYMKRRRSPHADRGGDPLAGLAVLFPIGIVFALGFLLAALWGVPLQDLISSEQMAIVSNPGTSDIHILIRRDGKLSEAVLSPGQQTAIAGTVVGSVYQLPDGSFIYVPVSEVTTMPSATPAPSPTPTETTGASPTPSPFYSSPASPSSPDPSGSPLPGHQPGPAASGHNSKGGGDQTAP